MKLGELLSSEKVGTIVYRALRRAGIRSDRVFEATRSAVNDALEEAEKVLSKRTADELRCREIVNG